MVATGVVTNNQLFMFVFAKVERENNKTVACAPSPSCRLRNEQVTMCDFIQKHLEPVVDAST